MPTYFVHADLNDLYVAWEVARGVLISADSHSDINPNLLLSSWGAKNLAMAMVDKEQFKDELKLEEIRRIKYPRTRFCVFNFRKPL